MREILYRGKCIKYDDMYGCVDDDMYGWAQGYYVCLEEIWKKRKTHRIYNGLAEFDCGEFYADYYEVDPETVSQFAGLLDKNGNRIYEGDIILYRENNIGVVDFADGAFGVRFNNGTSAMFLCFAADYSVVIGNIYDNPELLG